MNAEEAKKKAYDYNINQDEGQLKEIMNMINDVASKGYYDTNYYKTLRPDVLNKLEELGYEIHTSYDRNETIVNIKWN